ncbi:MAG: potassium-transporting ATPase subunit KdpA, partial [Clostridiales bacterium]
MIASVLQYILYLGILIILAIPLGAYIGKVMNGEKTIFTKILTPCEKLIYKIMRVKSDEEMTAKEYLTG